MKMYLLIIRKQIKASVCVPSKREESKKPRNESPQKLVPEIDLMSTNSDGDERKKDVYGKVEKPMLDGGNETKG